MGTGGSLVVLNMSKDDSKELTEERLSVWSCTAGLVIKEAVLLAIVREGLLSVRPTGKPTYIIWY